MYVRKFEADTIEEALRDIKRELGPDAVILKTLTNKGWKGAFKKKKIEITAAISEKNYVRKAQVDTVLDEAQKDEFYSGSAGYIANMIDKHDQSQEKSSMQYKNQSSPKNASGYGSAGLNRAVNSTRGIASQIKEGLDDFLSLGEREERASGRSDDFNFDDEIEATKIPPRSATPRVAPAPSVQAPKPAPAAKSLIAEELYEKQKNKIEEMEKKLFELTRSLDRVSKKEPIGVYQLRTTLKSLDINEVYIQHLIKKSLFELTETDVENADVVFEFALREMMGTVNTAMPVFSSTEKKSPVITVFLSELSSGQSSMVQKISTLKENSVVIRNTPLTIHPRPESQFTEKIFGMNIVKAQSISEIVSECRKFLEQGKSVFIDYKCNEAEANETKKFIDGLRRSFSKVEVLITLSAIHTELYNRKVLSTYRRLSDGIVVSHIDACLNFGSLFNITQDIKDLPYKFFGTGRVCPDDLELASAERLMAGIFKLS